MYTERCRWIFYDKQHQRIPLPNQTLWLRGYRHTVWFGKKWRVSEHYCGGNTIPNWNFWFEKIFTLFYLHWLWEFHDYERKWHMLLILYATHILFDQIEITKIILVILNESELFRFGVFSIRCFFVYFCWKTFISIYISHIQQLYWYWIRL